MYTAGTGTGRIKVLVEDVTQPPRADSFISKPANEENENALTSMGVSSCFVLLKKSQPSTPAGSAGWGETDVWENDRKCWSAEVLPEHLTPWAMRPHMKLAQYSHQCGPRNVWTCNTNGGGGKKWGHWEADGLTDGATEMDKQQKTQ